MRAVVQRVSSASVIVEDVVAGAIGDGLLIYLAVENEDHEEDAAYVAEKVGHLRIFPDAESKMNLDVAQAGGKLLVISAFTVAADARYGRRPSFEPAAPAELANQLYQQFCALLESMGLHVERGVFRAVMAVASVNAGPVCILLDSRRRF